MYTISFDDDSRTLLIVTEGCWSIATTAKFSAEVLAKGAAIRLRHGPFQSLVDARAATVQPQEVVAALEVLVPRALRISASPIAVVVSSQLLKMQNERYLKSDNTRVFLSMDEAKAWLGNLSALAA